MVDSTVKVTKVQQQLVTVTGGQQKNQVVITFTVGEQGPFTEAFDKATYDPAAVQSALQTFAQKIAQLPGLGS